MAKEPWPLPVRKLTGNRHVSACPDSYANSWECSFGLNGENHGEEMGSSNDPRVAAIIGSSLSSRPMLSSFLLVVQRKLYLAEWSFRIKHIRPKKQVRHNVSPKGVVTCATCGSQVSWQLQKGRYYGACQRRDERCKNRKYKYIREDVVQEVVKQELERLLCPSQSVLE